MGDFERFHKRSDAGEPTRFFKRSDQRIEELDGKWKQLKQWFDKKAITTNALFAALGYCDQYRLASENIPLYKAQVKLGQSRPLFDQKAREFQERRNILLSREC